MNTRKTAILTGTLFIVATAASLLGTGLKGSMLTAPDYMARISADGNLILVGALLTFIAAAASASIAIALYPVLKNYNDGLALGAVCFRLMEGIFYIAGSLCLVSLVPLSQNAINAGEQGPLFSKVGSVLLTANDLAGFVFGVLALCVGGLCYYFVFFQTGLIPRWLSLWGVVAIVLMVSATMITLFDGAPFSISGNLIFLALPIFLQEIVLAVWLIIKGFDPAALASESARVNMTPPQFVPQH